ncbi:hypothetical protein GKG26_05470 [Megasphaera sp. BIOML-A1]|uniref:hypothetical protein n=1 Tax=unclassified Megasphaera TaxID=2626256 RepID=UPI0012B03AD5|nr:MULTISPECIES: hypothetical protein [unclassified Megasphaera]MSA05111.1 hypothetical protein [Megasphaera sp. BIOML-A2]MSB88904.1 hypothetical protein [Megasphaera sp. BIOML-A1]
MKVLDKKKMEVQIQHEHLYLLTKEELKRKICAPWGDFYYFTRFTDGRETRKKVFAKIQKKRAEYFRKLFPDYKCETVQTLIPFKKIKSAGKFTKKYIDKADERSNKDEFKYEDPLATHGGTVYDSMKILEYILQYYFDIKSGKEKRTNHKEKSLLNQPKDLNFLEDNTLNGRYETLHLLALQCYSREEVQEALAFDSLELVDKWVEENNIPKLLNRNMDDYYIWEEDLLDRNSLPPNATIRLKYKVPKYCYSREELKKILNLATLEEVDKWVEDHNCSKMFARGTGEYYVLRGDLLNYIDKEKLMMDNVFQNRPCTGWLKFQKYGYAELTLLILEYKIKNLEYLTSHDFRRKYVDYQPEMEDKIARDVKLFDDIMIDLNPRMYISRLYGLEDTESILLLLYKERRLEKRIRKEIGHMKESLFLKLRKEYKANLSSENVFIKDEYGVKGKYPDDFAHLDMLFKGFLWDADPLPQGTVSIDFLSRFFYDEITDENEVPFKEALELSILRQKILFCKLKYNRWVHLRKKGNP